MGVTENFHWIGLIQQLGETAVAFATGVSAQHELSKVSHLNLPNFFCQAIAVHTFVVFWLRKGSSNMKLACLVIAFSWLYVILYVTIAVTTKPNFYSPDPVSLLAVIPNCRILTQIR